MTRPSWDEYFIEIALAVAKRSTCNRKQVGCVLVSKNKHIIATGYGGSIKGQPHCLDVGCLIDEKTGGCIRTVHAEMNAVAQAARNGASTEDSTAYTTLSPCYWCFKTLVNAGITRIVYFEEYRIPPDDFEAFACGVELVHFSRLEEAREKHGKETPKDIVLREEAKDIEALRHIAGDRDGEQAQQGAPAEASAGEENR